MKKASIVIIMLVIITIISMIICTANVNAAQGKAIDDQTESKLVEIKDNAAKSIEDYQAKYELEN